MKLAGQAPTNAQFGIEISVHSDTSKVNDGLDSATAGGKAISVATAAAGEQLGILEDLLKGFGDNAVDKKISVFRVDRNGQLLAGAGFDASGSLDVYGSGGWGGAKGEINMHLPAIHNAGQSQYGALSSEIMLARYSMTALLDQFDQKAAGRQISSVA